MSQDISTGVCRVRLYQFAVMAVVIGEILKMKAGEAGERFYMQMPSGHQELTFGTDLRRLIRFKTTPLVFKMMEI